MSILDRAIRLTSKYDIYGILAEFRVAAGQWRELLSTTHERTKCLFLILEKLSIRCRIWQKLFD